MPEEADERREDGTTQSLVPDPQDTRAGLGGIFEGPRQLRHTP